MQRKHFLLLTALALAVAIAAWILRGPGNDGNADPAKARGATPQPNTLPAGNGDGDATATGGRNLAEPALGDSIASALNALIASADASRIKAALDALAHRFERAPAGEATKAIGEFLDGRKDGVTRLPFAIGDGGNLATAPTFRVWMLDQLGRVNPEAAADYAKSILAIRESADEWAVAMRDFARVRTAPDDVAFLSRKMRELLAEPRWQAEQSAGWLEAFDVAVHTRATELTPDFARLVIRMEKQDKAAAYAAFLTLDRLVQAAPVDMLERLQAEPDLMKGRELTRANYFARADVRDPQQREAVERYLLDSTRSPEELAKFAGLYPNANMMISKNLLTPTVTPSGDELRARDREALIVVEDWLQDARLASVKPYIESIRARLANFVEQVKK